MKKKVSITVLPEDDNLKLEAFLKNRLHLTKKEISRAKFIENGICIDGERKRIDAHVRTGNLVEILLETGEETSKSLPDSQAAVSVLYEDADVIVLDKPAGISVHPAGKLDTDSLANRLAHYLRTKGEDSVIRIFGRLDKETSGVVLAAKNRAAATRLEWQRQKRFLFKTYLAIVEGTPNPQAGKVSIPLAKDPKNAKQMCPDPGGKSAVTYYETLTSREGLSLLRLHLETGRTHQIRVHMAAIGCPLVDDPLYGNKAPSKIGRTALHAQTVHFLQPFTGEEIAVTAPVPFPPFS